MTIQIVPVRPAIPDIVPTPAQLADLMARAPRAPRAPIMPAPRAPLPVPVQPPRPLVRPPAQPRMPVGVINALGTLLTIADLAEQYVAPRWFDWLERETGWRWPRSVHTHPLPPLRNVGEYIPYNLRYWVRLRDGARYDAIHEGMIQLAGPILSAYWDWSHPTLGTAVPRRLSVTGHYTIPWVVVIGPPNPDAGTHHQRPVVVSALPRDVDLMWTPVGYRIEPANPNHHPLPTISPYPGAPIPVPYHPEWPPPQPQQRPLPVRPMQPSLPVRVRPCVPDTLPTRPDRPILIPVRVPVPIPVPTPYPVPVPTPYPVPVTVPQPTPYPVPVPTPYPVPVTVPQPNPERVPVPVVVPYEVPQPVVWGRVAPPVRTRPPAPDVDASIDAQIRYLVQVSTIIADTSCPDPCPPCDCPDPSPGSKPTPMSVAYVVRTDNRCEIRTGIIHAVAWDPSNLADLVNDTAQMALESCGREPVAAIPEAWPPHRVRRNQLTIIYRARSEPRGHYQITVPHWVWGRDQTEAMLHVTPYQRGNVQLVATHDDNTRVIIRAIDEQTARRVYNEVTQGQSSQVASTATIDVRQRGHTAVPVVEPYKCNYFAANNLTSHPDWSIYLFGY